MTVGIQKPKSADGNREASPESVRLPHVQYKTAAVRQGEEDLCFPNVYGNTADPGHTYTKDPSFRSKPSKPSMGRPRTSPAISSTQVFGDQFPAPPTKALMSASARKLDSPRKKRGMKKKTRDLPQLPDGDSNNSRPQSAPAADNIDHILAMAHNTGKKSQDVDDHFEYNVWKVLTVVDFRRTVPPRPLFEVKENAKEKEKFRVEREEVVMYCQKFGTALADCLECFSRMCKDRLARPDPNWPVDAQIKFEQDSKQKAAVAKIKVLQVKAWQSRLKGDKYVNQAQAFLTNKDIKGAWGATERAAKGFNGYAKSKYFQSLQNSAGYTLDEKSDDSYRFKCAVALLRHLYPQFVRLSSKSASASRESLQFLDAEQDSIGIIKSFSFMERFHIDFPDLAAISKSRLDGCCTPLEEFLPKAIEMRDWSRAALNAEANAAKTGLDATYFALNMAEQARVASAKLSAKDAARIAFNAAYFADLAVAIAAARVFALVVYRDASGFTAAAEAVVSKRQCFAEALTRTNVAVVNVIMQVLFKIARADSAAAEARVAYVRTCWIANQMVAAAEAKVAFMKCVKVANSFAKAANLRLAVVVCNRVADARVARESEEYKYGLDQLAILDSEGTMGRFREMQAIHNSMLPKDGHKKIVSYFSECQEEQPNSSLMQQIPQRMVVNLCLANLKFISSANKLRQWLRHALLADLLASRVCYWAVKETELRLVALDSQMSVMCTIREARMRVFVAEAKVSAIVAGNYATEELALAKADAAKNFCKAVVRARENRKTLDYKKGLDELYSLQPVPIRSAFEDMQAKLDDFPVPLAIQNCDEELQLNLGDDMYLMEMKKLQVWLEAAQKAEKDACLISFEAYAAAWKSTAKSVAVIAVIQAHGAAAASLITADIANIAYEKAMREYLAATEFQKIVRALEGRKAFKRRRAAVAAQRAAAIGKYAAGMGSFYDHVTTACIGSIFCAEFARKMIASACVKRCALTCKGAETSAKRSQRFAVRMQLKAEKEFSACQTIQARWRGLAYRVFVRDAIKAKTKAVAAAEQAAAVAKVCAMQAFARSARITAEKRFPYAVYHARKMARRAAGASQLASSFCFQNVVSVKARMRSHMGTKENWNATLAAIEAALSATTMAEMSMVASKNADQRHEQEEEERNHIIKEGEQAKEGLENDRIEEDAEEEATGDKRKKDREPAEQFVAQHQAEYDEIKAEQDGLLAMNKKSKAKKLDKKMKPVQSLLDEAQGKLSGLEEEHEAERVDRVEAMMEERTDREAEAKKIQDERDKQLYELAKMQKSRDSGENPDDYKEEVLPSLEVVRLDKELAQEILSERDRIATIRGDLSKAQITAVTKKMKVEYENKIERIWAGKIARRGYASIKLAMAAMSMQKVIRAHAGRKFVLATLAMKKQEEMEGWMED